MGYIGGKTSLTNFLLTSWDIQVHGSYGVVISDFWGIQDGIIPPWKFKSSPLKSDRNTIGKANVFHHFSGVNSLLSFRRVRKDLQGWVKDKKMLNMISKDDKGPKKGF